MLVNVAALRLRRLQQLLLTVFFLRVALLLVWMFGFCRCGLHRLCLSAEWEKTAVRLLSDQKADCVGVSVRVLIASKLKAERIKHVL
jgi:hypothetical protein